MNVWFIILAVAAYPVWASSAPWVVHFSPTTIVPGEHAVLELSLSRSETDGETTPAVNDSLLAANKKTKLVLQDFKLSDDAWTWRYDITAYEPGEYSVPPIQITLEGRSYSSESQTLKVQATRAAGDTALRPEFGEVSLYWNWRPFAGWLSVLLVSFLAVAWAHRLMRRWASRFQPYPPPPSQPEISPKAWLMEALGKLESDLKANRSIEKPVDAYTSILRRYYSLDTKRNITGFTTEEMLKELTPSPALDALRPLLHHCDLYKFAPNPRWEAIKLTTAAIHRTRRYILC